VQSANWAKAGAGAPLTEPDLWPAALSSPHVGPPAVSTDQNSTPLLLLGRHALLAYVAHLAVLGLLDLTGAVPRSALATWGFILALSAGATLLAWTLERPRRSAARRA